MLTTWLNGYGPSNLETLLALGALGALIAVGYWLMRRRWQGETRRLQAALGEEQRQSELLQGEPNKTQRQRELDEVRHQSELDAARSRHDPVRIRELHDHLQRVIAHEFVKGLHFIDSECEEVVAGLRGDQLDLRRRLNGVRAKALEIAQHARNIVELPDLERNAARREPVRLNGLLEAVLKELLPYAEARGVHLQTDFGSLEPIFVSRPLVFQMYRNIIHNAIKYSPKDKEAVVGIKTALSLGDDGTARAIVDVRDRGRGIESKDKDGIFEARVRGDGLVEPGSGLGLSHARKIARLHGGDVVLVESNLHEGSTFRIILPYDDPNDSPKSDKGSEGETP